MAAVAHRTHTCRPVALVALTTLAALLLALLTAVGSARAAVPTPRAHYPLTSATALTDAGGAQAFSAGALVNGRWTASHLDLTANNSYLADNTFRSFALGAAEAATFAFDVRLAPTASGSPSSTILTYGSNATTSNLSVRPFHTPTTAAVTVSGGGATAVVATFPALTRGLWQHVAVSVVSGGEVVVSVDGVEVARGTTPRTLAQLGDGVFRLNRNATDFTNVPSQYRDLLVYDRALTGPEITEVAAQNATFAVDQLAAGLATGTPVLSDLTLPTGPGITWTSSDPDVIGADGEVTRPSDAAGDARVTLTVALQRAGQTVTASRDLTVAAVQVYQGVPVGQPWYDSAGDSIQAHGGGFLQHEGAYYWVGEDKTHHRASFNGVNLYRSEDLVNWTFVAQILSPEAEGLDCGTTGAALCKVERPKLLVDDETGGFVLYGHWETADSYAASELVVATSDTLDGDYEVLWHERPGASSASSANTVLGAGAYLSRDFTAYRDAEGNGWIFSAQGSGDTRVYPLTDGLTRLDVDASYEIEGHHREAPAVAYIDGYYYLLTSAQSGWYANQTVYVYTDDLSQDVWSEQIPVGNNTSFRSQPTNVMQIGDAATGYSYVYMGDRWRPDRLGDSSYVWLPLDLGDTRADGSHELGLDYTTDWSLDAATGAIVEPDLDDAALGRPATSAGGGSASPGYGNAGPAVPAAAANDGVTYNLATYGSDTHFFSPTLNVAKSVVGGAALVYDWQVDLGEARDLARVDVAWRNYNGSEPYNGYRLYGSTDAQSWQLLVDASANTSVGFTSDFVTGAYQHVRIEVTRVVNAHNGNSATWASGLVEVSVLAERPEPPAPDTTKPAVTLTAPTGAGPYSGLTLGVEATDDVGLARIVANVYRGTTLVRSTQTAVEGAASGTHTATLVLPDGVYTVRYNAHDTAGNVSATGSVEVRVDATAPTVTVKTGSSFTVSSGESYTRISVKLYDAGRVDRAVLNGRVIDLVDNTWSDLNFLRPGFQGAVLGLNTLVVYDVAGNPRTFEFTLA